LKELIQSERKDLDQYLQEIKREEERISVEIAAQSDNTEAASLFSSLQATIQAKKLQLGRLIHFKH
jgi:hypothetical protein